MVALIDDDQAGLRQLHHTSFDGAAMQRLYARHLHDLKRPRLNSRPDDAVRDPAQLIAGLGNDLSAVGEKQRTRAFAFGPAR